MYGPRVWAGCFVSTGTPPSIIFGNGCGFIDVTKPNVGEYRLTLAPDYYINDLMTSVCVQPSTFNPHGSTVHWVPAADFANKQIDVFFTNSAGAPADTDFFITIFRTRDG